MTPMKRYTTEAAGLGDRTAADLAFAREAFFQALLEATSIARQGGEQVCTLDLVASA